jgi:hypothetical protein
VTKYLTGTKVERFILDHGFRGFNSWSIPVGLRQGRTSWLGEHGRAVTHLVVGSRERERRWEWGPQSQAPSDPFPPTRIHFLTAHSIMNASMDYSIQLMNWIMRMLIY